MNDNTTKTIRNFAAVPVRAAMDRELGAAPLRVLIMITAHADKNGRCFPAQGTIAEKLGITQQAVSQHIKKLKERGYLKAIQRAGTSCIYEIQYEQKEQQANLVADTSLSCSPSQADLLGVQAPDLVGVTSSGTCTNTTLNKPLKEKEPKAIRSLEALEASNLNGHYQNWFEEKAPDIDRFRLRDDLIFYCRSHGKEYRDYWATLQTWATKQQRVIDAKTQKEKQWSPF